MEIRRALTGPAAGLDNGLRPSCFAIHVKSTKHSVSSSAALRALPQGVSCHGRRSGVRRGISCQHVGQTQETPLPRAVGRLSALDPAGTTCPLRSCSPKANDGLNLLPSESPTGTVPLSNIAGATRSKDADPDQSGGTWFLHNNLTWGKSLLYQPTEPCYLGDVTDLSSLASSSIRSG